MTKGEAKPSIDQVPPRDPIAAVALVGERLARPAAARVDAEARLPSEALAGLREVGALGAAVPSALGGAGLGLEALSRTCSALARHCGSSGMILAMHHIEVLAISRHRGSVAQLDDYLRSVASEQRLIASVTSEVGTEGELQRSIAAVVDSGGRFTLNKDATVISYAGAADDLLITARSGPDAQPNDQVLVLALRDDFELDIRGRWDALGMRGTCSPPARVEARGASWQILPVPFADIAARTMVPSSHVLWASCWLGIAQDAVSIARTCLRARQRKRPDAAPGPHRLLARAVQRLQTMRAEILSIAREVDADAAGADGASMATVGFAVRMNNLKLSASRAAVEIVTDALEACGIAGYKNDSPHSLGRHLRDVHSAPLMIGNSRILETNAQLMLLHKGDEP